MKNKFQIKDKIKKVFHKAVRWFKRKLKKFKEFFEVNPKRKVLFLVVFIILVAVVAVTLGRYIYYEARDFYFASKNFYFNCDKLEEHMSRYQVDNWSGVDDYTITFNMNSYKNNIVFSTSDIPYDITYSCSSNITCSATKTSGLINTSRHTDSFSITLSPNSSYSDGDSVWLEVQTESNSPYHKSLSGRFVIKVGKIGLSYEIVDKPNQPYFDLNITNTLDYYIVKQSFDRYSVGQRINIDTYLSLSDANKEKCSSAKVSLDFDPTVTILDMTNEAYLNRTTSSSTGIGGYTYIDGFDFKIDALTSAVVRFYKADTTLDYTYPFTNPSSIIDVEFE